jgi:hypothetical protein
MSDVTAKMARLMRVTDAVVQELDRQGVAEVMANLTFDPIKMAQSVIRAADGDVIPFPQSPRPLNIRRVPARRPVWTLQRARPPTTVRMTEADCMKFAERLQAARILLLRVVGTRRALIAGRDLGTARPASPWFKRPGSSPRTLRSVAAVDSRQPTQRGPSCNS